MKHYIKIENENIIMDKSFAKRAAIYGTTEYFQLQACRRDYPEFIVSTRSIKKNPGKESYKGLTYEYMEGYIMSHDNAEKNMMIYRQKREIAECHSVRYPHIKKWFLETYPEVVTYGLENNLPTIQMINSQKKEKEAV